MKELNVNDFGGVNPQKITELRERIKRLGIELPLIEEKFVKGGGKRGQKINKTSNAVMLRYPPFGLVIRCQRERARSVNRFLALRELADRIEMKISPETSERLREMEKIRKRKQDRARKSRGAEA